MPALALAKVNHVQVVPTWMNGAVRPAYFFSFRQQLGWDTALRTEFVNGLSVHIYNGSRARYSPEKPQLQGVMNQVRGARFIRP
jgi:hypothetical protein